MNNIPEYVQGRLKDTNEYVFLGWQYLDKERIALYNLLVGNNLHPVGSTVSEETLKRMGLVQ